jgi:hypothetical protein
VKPSAGVKCPRPCERDCQRWLRFIRISPPRIFRPQALITSRNLILAAVLLLTLSVIFGVLNLKRTRELRADATRAEAARLAAENLGLNREKDLAGREAAIVAARVTLDDTQKRAANTEAALLQAQTEKSDLQAKLRQSESEIAELRKRAEESKPTVAAAAPPAASATELRAELEDAKKRLDAAEREKELLSDKIKITQERASQLESERKSRPAGGGSPAIRGTVLAVNQAYNFVVLSLGSRQGVEANSEMLVLRGGSFICRIRISSVEPATAIGDIITSSLARGVQVQPGDTVIYAGNNS